MRTGIKLSYNDATLMGVSKIKKKIYSGNDKGREPFIAGI